MKDSYILQSYPNTINITKSNMIQGLFGELPKLAPESFNTVLLELDEPRFLPSN